MRNNISVGAFILAVALSNAAHAQTSNANQEQEVPKVADDSALGDIVVTAQRRNERLQDIPISVTAISADTLASNRIVSTKDIQFAVPTLVYSSAVGYAAPYLRGIGTDHTFPNADPSVATYIDGVFVSNNVAVLQNLLGIERVEVLAGPQGTLYGRNAVAGAIGIYTLTPTQDLQAKFTGTYGNYNLAEGSGYVSGGVTDTLAVGIYGGYSRHDTFLKRLNNLPGEPNHESNWGLRGKAVWKPTDSLTFTGAIEHLEGKSFEGAALRNIQQDSLLYSIGARRQIGKHIIDSDAPAILDSKQTNYMLRSELDLGWSRLASITGYRDFKVLQADDTDATNIDLFRATSKLFSRQFSQETQLLSPDGSAVSWIAGLFYFDELSGFDPQALTGTVFAPVGGITQTTKVKLRSYAAFGQVTIPIDAVAPGLKLTLGGRYTVDRKRFRSTSFLTAPDPQVPIPTTPIPGTINFFTPPAKTWKNFSPKITLDYKIGDTLLYATYSEGFKAGVYNVNSPADAGPVDPEKLKSYEIGIKTEMLGRRLRLNTAGYYYRYSNIQLSRLGGAGGGVQTLENAGSAEAYGIETHLEASVTPELVLNATAAWEDTRYLKYDNAASFIFGPNGNVSTPIDASGNPLLRAPKWVFSAGGAYNHTFANDGAVNAEVRWYYNDGFSWEASNQLRQSSYHLINASLGYSFPGDRLSISVFGANLNNAHYFNNVIQTPFNILATDATPRTYGASLTVKY